VGWFNRLSGQDADLELIGEGILLRPPRPQDFAQWRDLRIESRAFLTPWEPKWTDDELSSLSYRLRLRAQRRAMTEGTAQPFFIFATDGVTLLGGINITNIRRGIAQSGTLGYWIGLRHAGQGHMSRAVAVITAHARNTLHLHRLEAACLPSNQPSMHLLARAGFDKEGFAKAYLNINGTWEDHVLWGKQIDP
jgi:[ribosomal protein S5]-alanine N-acetyltransferase